jgi:hypothetical protein
VPNVAIVTDSVADLPPGTYWIRVEYRLEKSVSGYRVLMVNINPPQKGLVTKAVAAGPITRVGTQKQRNWMFFVIYSVQLDYFTTMEKWRGSRV